jgi:hypothetical protein
MSGCRVNISTNFHRRGRDRVHRARNSLHKKKGSLVGVVDFGEVVVFLVPGATRRDHVRLRAVQVAGANNGAQSQVDVSISVSGSSLWTVALGPVPGQGCPSRMAHKAALISRSS